jgi:glycosyltransferase involved in cell wall biosynthesis
MRIVHLIFALNVGGAETMLADIIREQSLHAEVFVVIINSEYNGSVLRSLDEKAGVIKINRPPSSKNPWYFIKLNRVLRRLKPDILHTHNNWIINMIPFWIAPVVATIHGTKVKLSGSTGRYRKIFAISEAVKEDLLARDPSLDIDVIYNGIEFSGIRRKENYGGMPFKIVQIGSLNHLEKGQDIMIQALRYVNDRIGEGNVTVDFIGEGDSRKYLEALASDLGVARWSRFLGLLSRWEVYDLLHSYDLLIQPSRNEGFGLTVVEGMAAGVPVLVSNIDGPMEIIGGGRYGFFFRNEDFKDCGEKIIEAMVLSKEQDIAIRLSQITEYAKKRFDVALTANRYLQEYQRIISALS